MTLSAEQRQQRIGKLMREQRDARQRCDFVDAELSASASEMRTAAAKPPSASGALALDSEYQRYEGS